VLTIPTTTSNFSRSPSLGELRDCEVTGKQASVWFEISRCEWKTPNRVWLPTLAEESMPELVVSVITEPTATFGSAVVCFLTDRGLTRVLIREREHMKPAVPLTLFWKCQYASISYGRIVYRS
jgi:hypothetical protein